MTRKRRGHSDPIEQVIELEDLSHYSTEPVAEQLEKTHPDLAALLWRAQGLRIVNASKSSFMPGFERLVAGTGPSDEPSFLDRAKAQWSARERRAQ